MDVRIDKLCTTVLSLCLCLALMPVRATALQVLVPMSARDGAATQGEWRQAEIWAKDQRALTYWIDAAELCGRRPAAATPCAREATVVASLAAAARDWENACPTCGVSFTRTLDRDRATFRVRYISAVLLRSGEKQQPDYVARSFYPRSEMKNRVLRLSPSFFSGPLDPIGVMRHELGHILGYAHENSCAGKVNALPANLRSITVTQADDRSVMRQPCGNMTADGTTPLSALDIADHRKIYGPVVAPPG